MWGLPGPGIELVSPALAGRFFTTESPGKPLYLFMYFQLHWVFVAAHRLSLVAANGGNSLVAVCGHLIAVASVVAEHRLSSCGAWA